MKFEYNYIYSFSGVPDISTIVHPESRYFLLVDIIAICRYQSGNIIWENWIFKAKTEPVMPSQFLWGRGYESVAECVLLKL